MTKITDNAMDLLQKRYFHEDEKTWEDLSQRVAEAVADAEETDGSKSYWYNAFYTMIHNMEFIPSSPCLMNANKEKEGQLSSCFIIELRDNIESICQAEAECAKIFQKNGGVGFNISVLRPEGSSVETSKGYSCGVCGFMEKFNLTADVMTRNNKRRGAIKIDLNDWHPDIYTFINCKNNTDKFQNMNISVSLSDRFMEAVKNDEEWQLKFPDYSWNKDIYNAEWDGDLDGWEFKGYPVKVYKTLKAQDLYREVMLNAWCTGEPGVSFRDVMDKDNPNPHLGKVDGTNPCSEFTSIPYNSCNLGSINLTTCINNGEFNKKKFKDLVSKGVRFLDNMITVNKLPLETIEKVTKGCRSVGLGVMGFADLLYMLKIPYNSKEGYDFADSLFSTMYDVALDTSEKLAKEKSVYELWKGSRWDKTDVKVRNSNFLSIAPTGSISFLANVSSSIEPNFALTYSRRTNEGDIYYVTNSIFKEELTKRDIYSNELMEKIEKNHGSCVGIDEVPKDMQEIFVTAHDIMPQEHVKMVGIIQKYVDLSISKTVNLPSEATVEDVEKVYLYAWEQGCKGITIYRDGARKDQTLATSRESKEGIKEKITDENAKRSAGQLGRGFILDVNDDVIGKKRKLVSGCGSLHCIALFDPDNGQLLETYLSKGSTGGCQNFMVGLSRMISLAARGGVDIYAIIDQLNSTGVCPSYAVRTAKRKDTSRGSCCPMAVGNALLDMYQEVLEELGIGDAQQEHAVKNTKSKQINGTVPNHTISGEKCPECEEELRHEGGCIFCSSCGYSHCN